MFIHTSSTYLFFLWWLYEETYRGHMVNIRRFRAFIFCIMSCVLSYTYMFQGNSCCSYDISHFAQVIWSILVVFVPLDVTLSFGIGLFAACHFSLLSLQFDRIVILFLSLFRFHSICTFNTSIAVTIFYLSRVLMQELMVFVLCCG